MRIRVNLKNNKTGSKKGLVRAQGIVKPSIAMRGTAPRARPNPVWPPGKPPGGKVEVKRQPDGSLSFKLIED